MRIGLSLAITQVQRQVAAAAFDPSLNLIPNGTFANATGVTLNTVGGNTPTISGGLLHFTGRGNAAETLLQPTVIGATYSLAFDIGPNMDDFPAVTVGGVAVNMATASQSGTNPIHVVVAFTATAASSSFLIAGQIGLLIDVDNLVLNRTA